MSRVAQEIDSDYDAGDAGYEALAIGRALQRGGQQVRCGGATPGQQEQPRYLVAGTFKTRGGPLRSRPTPASNGCLKGVSCGLGITWQDPRFEPGPHAMYPGRDAIWAHGGHAGGATFGALTPARFFQDGAWNTGIARGMGEGMSTPRRPRW